MSLDVALRLTEVLLGLALVVQSAEHLVVARTLRWVFAARAILSAGLIAGLAPGVMALGLLALGVLLLHRFHGPYNGGADRMSLLILVCLSIGHVAPDPQWREIAFGYLAVQLVLSYLLSGWVKARSPDWWSGQALADVFAFSAYPASENLRALADRPRVMAAASWAVIVFELAFPLALLTPDTLIIGLAFAFLFHLANAWLFGLNRFVWVWLAAFPSLVWLQHRLVG